MVHESMTSLTDFYSSNSCLAHTPDRPRPVTLGTDPRFKAGGVWTDLWEALKMFVPVTSSLRITYFELCTHSRPVKTMRPELVLVTSLRTPAADSMVWPPPRPPCRRAGRGRGKGQPPAALGPPPRLALGPPALSLLDRCDGGTVYYGDDPVDGELSPDEGEQEDLDAPVEHQASHWAIQSPCHSVVHVKSHMEPIWPYCK